MWVQPVFGSVICGFKCVFGSVICGFSVLLVVQRVGSVRFL